jgi:hypothetical protein
MIPLREEFKSSAGGFVPPLDYQLVKRNDTAAIYARKRENKVLGYEVFQIKVIPKGFTYKFPNGTTKTVEDDTEQYPSTSQFGITAWSPATLDRANVYFDKLTNTSVVDEPEIETISVKTPAPLVTEADLAPGEFTVNMFASERNMDYVRANLIVKASIEAGKFKLLRTQRLNGAKRPSNIYIKVN